MQTKQIYHPLHICKLNYPNFVLPILDEKRATQMAVATMETLYTSPFKTILWDDDNQVIRQVWTDTSQLSNENLRSELQHYLACVTQKKPNAILSFATNFNYQITPDVQEWIATNILGPFAQMGVRLYAQIVSPDIFTQVSIEQTLEEADDTAFRFQIFGSEESALVWIEQARLTLK
jgi:hypothetical protein